MEKSSREGKAMARARKAKAENSSAPGEAPVLEDSSAPAPVLAEGTAREEKAALPFPSLPGWEYRVEFFPGPAEAMGRAMSLWGRQGWRIASCWPKEKQERVGGVPAWLRGVEALLERKTEGPE